MSKVRRGLEIEGNYRGKDGRRGGMERRETETNREII